MSTTHQDTREPGLRRRVRIGAGVAAAVALLVALALWLGSGDDGSSAAAGGASASTVSDAPVALAPTEPTPEPSGPTDVVDEAPPSRAAVALDQPAEVGDGVTASITMLEGIDGTANGPGNVAGPALRVTVRIDNGTNGPVSLGGVSVDLASGSELVPASPLEDPSEDPFAGTIAPGEHAEGVYVFSISEEDRESVTVSVGYQAGAPILVFTGPVR